MTVISTDQSGSGSYTFLFTDHETVTVKSDVVVENTNPNGGIAFGTTYAGCTLNNAGYVYGSDIAFYSTGAGTRINNAASGTITGAGGIYLTTGDATVTNYGAIEGTAPSGKFRGVGVNLDQSHGENITITNHGTISGVFDSGGASISASDGCNTYIVNTGLLQGAVYLSGFSVINNSGHIDGSIYFGAGYSGFSNSGSVDGDVYLSNGADTIDLRGGTVSGEIRGYAGDDVYTIDSQATAEHLVEFADGGTDTVRAFGMSLTLASFANFENLTLLGSGNYNLTGNAGANVLTGNNGVNVLNGGAGDDIYYVQNTGDRIVEAANGGTDTVHATIDFSLAGTQLENLVLDGTAVKGVGNALANTITGNAQANYIDGGTGADSMSGFAGNDIYFVDNAGDRVFEAANGGTDAVYSSVSFSANGQSIEQYLLTGTANISVTGTDSAETFTGNSRTNIFTGLGGNDNYYVQNVGDRIVEAVDGGTDAVHSTVSFQLGANLENLYLIGTASIDGTGNAGDNLLYGNSATNKLTGGAGNDTYYVQNTGDTIVEAANGGNDTVHSTFTFSLAGTQLENLTLDGTASISASGNLSSNQIIGNSGANTITGFGGDDLLAGGAGADTFVFRPSFGQDVLTDFAAGDGVDHDIMRIDRSLFADFNDLMAHTTDGSVFGPIQGAIIRYDSVNAIGVAGVTKASLTAADFLFV